MELARTMLVELAVDFMTVATWVADVGLRRAAGRTSLLHAWGVPETGFLHSWQGGLRGVRFSDVGVF